MLGAQWQAFLIAAALMAIAPGANQLLSLRNAVRQGFWDASVALAGRFSAFLLLVAATVAGLGALLLASEQASAVVKWCGVVYLLYLGGRMLYNSRGTATGDGGQETRRSSAHRHVRQSRWELTCQEFLVAMTNPKAMLLFAAFLPQFADHGSGTVPFQLAALGVAYIGVEFLAALVYAGVGGKLAAASMTASMHRWFDRATGLTMIAIAGWLAFEHR